MTSRSATDIRSKFISRIFLNTLLKYTGNNSTVNGVPKKLSLFPKYFQTFSKMFNRELLISF